MLLKFEGFKNYIEKFNRDDEETIVQYVDNDLAQVWLSENIPLFECPDKDIEEVYYFRWWVYRKHIKETVDGFLITEFLPNVPWAGKHNSIVCAAGHHIYEGRWILNGKYIEDYARFWYKKGGSLRSYSSWLGDAIWQYCTVKGDFSLALELLEDFIADYREWEKTNRHESGLFWSNDDRDGGEFSISGSGLRPTLNSYMFGYANVIAKTAKIAKRVDVFEEFSAKAASLKKLINEKLWDEKDNFFKVIPLDSKDNTVVNWSFDSIDPNHNVQEWLGYIPWYFNIPVSGYEVAWKRPMQKDGFYAPFGLTTAEQRHSRFMFKAEHECLWNGPSWPFATAMVLSALANLLNNYEQNCISKKDYFELLKQYTKCHKREKPDGTVIRWLDENLDPYTGDWISRTILENWGWKPEKGGRERGKDYNHSTYCDLIITGLIGLRPREDETIVVNPLISDGLWDYFCIDKISYHGRQITIFYDKYGNHYNKGKGFYVFADGKEIGYSENLGTIICRCIE